MRDIRCWISDHPLVGDCVISLVDGTGNMPWLLTGKYRVVELSPLRKCRLRSFTEFSGTITELVDSKSDAVVKLVYTILRDRVHRYAPVVLMPEGNTPVLRQARIKLAGIGMTVYTAPTKSATTKSSHEIAELALKRMRQCTI